MDAAVPIEDRPSSEGSERIRNRAEEVRRGLFLAGSGSGTDCLTAVLAMTSCMMLGAMLESAGDDLLVADLARTIDGGQGDN